MSKSKPPPLLRLSDMTPGQQADFFAVLAEKIRSTTRDGKPYYLCRFRDNRRSAALMVWEDSGRFEECERDWREGQFYKIRAVYDDRGKYGPQITDIEKFRPVVDADRAEGFNPAELVEHSRFDADAMFAELRGLAESHIAVEPLRRLVLTILTRHADRLKQLPATPRHFYPFAGGLLEHTLSVTRTCLHLVDKYAIYYSELNPPLNRDLVTAGAILHDIGRVLEYEDSLGRESSVPGRLSGHLLLGRDLVRDTARELGDVPPDLVQLLEHVVLTHLGLPEWGSPRLPLIPECLIIHHADDLDAKLEMYVRCLTRDTAPGPFTDRDPILGKQLLKGRTC